MPFAIVHGVITVSEPPNYRSLSFVQETQFVALTSKGSCGDFLNVYLIILIRVFADSAF